MRKLNNGGFAISTLLYGLMIMSLLIVLALLSNLGSSRQSTTTFVDKIEDELNRLSVTDTEGEYAGGEVDNNGREYIAPTAGWYKIELWGAGGGGSNGGKGAYVSAIMYLDINDYLYFYVGEKGNKSTTFNGGGSASGSYYAGGGATDVRLISGSWNDPSSLESRLMVAAGGAGGGSSAGGAGGSLIGGNTSLAGTQSGGASFGKAANGSSSAAGGGGGYFGGKAANGAGGGSSFIMGYAGVRTRTNDVTSTDTIKTFQQIHLGEYVPAKDADGNPLPNAGDPVLEDYTSTIYNGLIVPGINSEGGKFKITKVSDNAKENPPRFGSNNSLKQVRYIVDCVDSNTSNTTGYWTEIQAIGTKGGKDGVNVAKGATVAASSGGTLQNGSRIVDGIADTTSSYAQISGSGTKCVKVTLGGTYDLSEIAVWHRIGYTFSGHTLAVSSDNSSWTYVRTKSSDSSSTGLQNEAETANGIRYNTFHSSDTGELVEGNYYIFSANSDNMVLSSYEESGITIARMEPFTGEDNQVWHVYKQADPSTGTEYYRMENTANNLALEVSDNSADIGVTIDLYQNNVENTAQNWNLNPLGNGYYIVTSQLNVRIGYNTSNSIVQTQSNTQNKTQRWKFVWADY